MTELQEILKIIKFETDLSFTVIGKRIDYRRETVERAYKLGENESILALLKDKFKKEISQFDKKYTRKTNSTPKDPTHSSNPGSGQADLEIIKAAVVRLEEVLKKKEDQRLDKAFRKAIKGNNDNVPE